jgi:hypothetical protein
MEYAREDSTRRIVACSSSTGIEQNSSPASLHLKTLTGDCATET